MIKLKKLIFLLSLNHLYSPLLKADSLERDDIISKGEKRSKSIDSPLFHQINTNTQSNPPLKKIDKLDTSTISPSSPYQGIDKGEIGNMDKNKYHYDKTIRHNIELIDNAPPLKETTSPSEGKVSSSPLIKGKIILEMGGNKRKEATKEITPPKVIHIKEGEEKKEISPLQVDKLENHNNRQTGLDIDSYAFDKDVENSSPFSLSLNDKDSPYHLLSEDEKAYSLATIALMSKKEDYRLIPILYAWGGGGANETKTGGTSLLVVYGGWIYGGSIEASSWYDAKTNTGKYTRSVYFDMCAAISLGSSAINLSPCFSLGSGEGEYKDRNVLNEIETHRTKRTVYKAYTRGLIITPSPYKGHLIFEIKAGYNEDAYIESPFVELGLITPYYINLGLSIYSSQRQATTVGINLWNGAKK